MKMTSQLHNINLKVALSKFNINHNIYDNKGANESRRMLCT